ncbi:hypothetical protein P8K40_004949 [Escherichia coli]|uniref:Uncharacterized protein n=2 Tax=Enterobacteriaceae TaxID=543 RepID=A0A8S7TSV9_ECOLX|nr:hypothetical protein [Salmonella enterica]ECS9819491.1 hypothetical protein [Salmonella enterica subsp. enterica serovar 4,[5],12:i:-]EEH9481909.1 hypothetical protein [Salmonella enterica subsp. enterica serovar Litchfield]EEV6143688.1 hypothetical protein [Escherichia coli]HAE8298998.1 hypothetical protein [Salmonella enterica subsp. enterica serovar Typhimurium]EAQ7915531.1 hypothetical protein [Salmonella enterica]
MNMTIPVKEKQSQTKTGNLTIHGSIHTLTVYYKPDADGKKVGYYGSLSAEKAGDVFYGGVPVGTSPSSGDTFAGAGLPTMNELQSMMVAKYPGITFLGNSDGLTGTGAQKLKGVCW